jgi:uncharacterized protein YegP (UPF0339 family)
MQYPKIIIRHVGKSYWEWTLVATNGVEVCTSVAWFRSKKSAIKQAKRTQKIMKAATLVYKEGRWGCGGAIDE